MTDNCDRSTPVHAITCTEGKKRSTKAKLKGLETKQYTCMVLTHPLWVSIMKGERDTREEEKTYNGVRDRDETKVCMHVYSWLCTHMESILASWLLWSGPVFSLTERSLRVLDCVRTCVKQREQKWTGVPHFTKPKLTHCCSFFSDVHYRTHLHSFRLAKFGLSHLLLHWGDWWTSAAPFRGSRWAFRWVSGPEVVSWGTVLTPVWWIGWGLDLWETACHHGLLKKKIERLIRYSTLWQMVSKRNLQNMYDIYFYVKPKRRYSEELFFLFFLIKLLINYLFWGPRQHLIV